eukprot:TRINITY_DN702_c0_g1_i2.p1 TRINITY_DN702_c0_g1~~TRINITY_DN702_c0_g1_i2.p1  ORF type:complete len:390 (-),score=137.55 TRINITY_DN702_c0_g1_i2:322-1491(-)
MGPKPVKPNASKSASSSQDHGSPPKNKTAAPAKKQAAPTPSASPAFVGDYGAVTATYQLAEDPKSSAMKASSSSAAAAAAKQPTSSSSTSATASTTHQISTAKKASSSTAPTNQKSIPTTNSSPQKPRGISVKSETVSAEPEIEEDIAIDSTAAQLPSNDDGQSQDRSNSKTTSHADPRSQNAKAMGNALGQIEDLPAQPVMEDEDLPDPGLIDQEYVEEQRRLDARRVEEEQRVLLLKKLSEEPAREVEEDESIAEQIERDPETTQKSIASSSAKQSQTPAKNGPKQSGGGKTIVGVNEKQAIASKAADAMERVEVVAEEIEGENEDSTGSTNPGDDSLSQDDDSMTESEDSDTDSAGSSTPQLASQSLVKKTDASRGQSHPKPKGTS